MIKVTINSINNDEEKVLCFPMDEAELDEILESLEIEGVDDTDSYEVVDVVTEFCESDDYALENLSLDELIDLADEVESLDGRAFSHVEAYMEAICDNLEQAINEYECFEFYEDYSLEDVAREVYESDVYNLPDAVLWAIDWEEVGSNLESEGHYETAYGVLEG